MILEFKTTGSGGFKYATESYHCKRIKYRMAWHAVETDTPSDAVTCSTFYFCQAHILLNRIEDNFRVIL